MSNDLQTRIEYAHTTLQWLNLAIDDSRRVECADLLDQAVHHSRMAVRAVEKVEAILNRPAETVREDRVDSMTTREPITPAELRLTGELYRGTVR